MPDENVNTAGDSSHDTEAEDRRELEKMREHVEHMSKLLVRRDIDLMNKNESLKNLDQTKSEFVSIAAHQLRTPLTAMIWAAESLLGDQALELNELQQKSLTHIHASGLRMSELIGALLNVSRLELGTIEKTLAPTNVYAVTGKVIASFGSAVKIKKLFVHADIQVEKVMTDTALFEMILSNLLENAIKYTPENGEVFVTFAQDQKQMKLTVRDTGQGIPEKERDKIFQKFYRASNVSDGTSGTGLGLHIVQMATQKLGGVVHVDSVINEGATFEVAFPHMELA